MALIRTLHSIKERTTKLIALFAFAAALASAQSLPAGSPTEVKVNHSAGVPGGCVFPDSILYGPLCQPSVYVEAASADPKVVGWIVMLFFTNADGSEHVLTQVTTTRQAAGSAFFATNFQSPDGALNITINSVIAVPLSPGVPASVNNVR